MGLLSAVTALWLLLSLGAGKRCYLADGGTFGVDQGGDRPWGGIVSRVLESWRWLLLGAITCDSLGVLYNLVVFGWDTRYGWEAGEGRGEPAYYFRLSRKEALYGALTAACVGTGAVRPLTVLFFLAFRRLLFANLDTANAKVVRGLQHVQWIVTLGGRLERSQ